MEQSKELENPAPEVPDAIDTAGHVQEHEDVAAQRKLEATPRHHVCVITG